VPRLAEILEACSSFALTYDEPSTRLARLARRSDVLRLSVGKIFAVKGKKEARRSWWSLSVPD
jgi:hypothetical protein